MRIRITPLLIEHLRKRRLFLRPQFDFGNAVGNVINVTNSVNMESYARISEGALSWGASVTIGAFSYITPSAYLPGCDIGRYTSIAAGVRVMGENHPTNRISTSTFSYGANVDNMVFQDYGVHINQNRALPTSHRTQIQNDVWIGESATLKRGITLCTGCIVGANAVVGKNVPPYAIVVGNPARIIRYRFDESVIDSLNTINWWNIDPAVLAKLDMCDVTKFIESAIGLAEAFTANFEKIELSTIFSECGDLVE